MARLAFDLVTDDMLTYKMKQICSLASPPLSYDELIKRWIAFGMAVEAGDVPHPDIQQNAKMFGAILNNQLSVVRK